MTTTKRTTNRIAAGLAALILAALLGACSGDDRDGVASVSDGDEAEATTTEEGDDTEAELLDWVECMRDQGIDMEDPTRDSAGNLVLGGGTDESGGLGGQAASANVEEMQAAEETCGTPPGIGPQDISAEDEQAIQAQALEFAQCMRDAGIEDFPDPDFSSSGPGGDPNMRDADDEEVSGAAKTVTAPFGDIDMDDPEVRAAFESCQDLLGVPGGQPGGVPGDGE